MADDNRLTPEAFAQQIKAKYPDYANVPDNVLAAAMLQKFPDYKSQVISPLEQANSQPLSEPTTFTGGFKKRLGQELLPLTNALPGAGAVVGGALSASGTMGGGTPLGIGLGAGAGKGLQDLINHYLGVDESTPLAKAMRIGGETAMAGGTAALLPGIVDHLKAPKESAADLLETAAHPKKSLDALIEYLRGQHINAPVTPGTTAAVPTPLPDAPIPDRLIHTADELQQLDNLRRTVTPTARLRGLGHAAHAAGDPSAIDDLLRQLTQK